MNTKTVCKILSVVISTAATQAAPAAGHVGGGGFGGGGFHGGVGGGSRSSGVARPSFNGGARFAFGVRPTLGRPVYVRPQSRIGSSTARVAPLAQQRGFTSSVDRRFTGASRPVAAPSANRPTERAQNHIFARSDANSHRDWDRRGAHYWNGHWWCWHGGVWIGLDDGFYPWDYYPYYAYDYYPYDYYPGYYADVEPYYNSNGVYDGVPAPDSNVTAVQQDLTNLGYYRGPIDGLYRRGTRDAIARYQRERHLAVTGTLTRETLESLGVSSAVPS